MNPDDLLALLGRHATDPLVEAALTQYAIRNRPELEIDEDDADGPVVETQSWVKNSRAGIEFGFQDEAAWIGLDKTEFGKQPMLLTQLYLYGQHAGVRPYQHELPFSMQPGDDRAAVRKRMMAFESTRHSQVRDTWDLPAFRMTVSYAVDGPGIGFVFFTLREPALPPLRYKLAPVPAIDALVDLLGLSVNDEAVKAALDPLGLQDRLGQIEDTGGVDFCSPYGLALDLVASPKMKGRDQAETLVLGVTLHQERELDSRAWPGELPCGLQFDDSPEMAARKLGRAPDTQIDDDFAGFAVWNTPKFSLRVFYTTMENRLLRVSIIAPGIVKAPEDPK